MSHFKDKAREGKSGGVMQRVIPLTDKQADYLGIPKGTSIRGNSDEAKRLYAMPEDQWAETREANDAVAKELERFAEWWGMFELAPSDDSMGLLMAQPSPIGIGDRVRFDSERKKGDAQWLVWRDGRRWVVDERGERHELFRSRLRAHSAFIASSGMLDEPKKKTLAALSRYMNVNPRENVFKDLATRTPIVVGSEFFDTKLNLLGVGNGVVDLDTGELRDGKPEDGISLSTSVNYDPAAEPVRFPAFLREVTTRPDGTPDEELADYLLLFLGYIVAGGNREERWAQFTGTGGNGKGKLKDILEHVLGDYAATVTSTMFMQTKQGREHSSRPDPSILDMRGRRIVFSSEPEGIEHRLNETLIKQVSGRDKVNARWLWSNTQVTYRFAQVIVLLTNKVLEVEDPDPAMRQRTIIFPFDQEFRGTDREDPDLLVTLQKEAEGILSMLIRTAVAYRQGRFKGGNRATRGMPERASVATTAYFDANNPLGLWKGERLVPGDDWTSSADLLAAYKLWYDWKQKALGPANMPEYLTDRKFYLRLGQLGLKSSERRVGTARNVKGYEVELKVGPEAATEGSDEAA